MGTAGKLRLFGYLPLVRQRQRRTGQRLQVRDVWRAVGRGCPMNASELERELKERAPLLRWRVTYGEPGGPGEPDEHMLWAGASLTVNDNLLRCSTAISPEMLGYPNVVSEMLHRTARAMADALLAWRPPADDD